MWVATTMSFFDVTKYPPSLHYVLVMLGLAFTIRPLLTRLRGRGADVLVTLLRCVPLFVYVVHIYLTHALAVAANAVAGPRRCRAVRHVPQGDVEPRLAARPRV